MTSTEITIPVPWGHIAAKTWGSPNEPPILTVHGIFDNAGSFDSLIPFLPNSYHYICIDLPGHGKSSHFPAHILIDPFNYVLAYRLVVKHFNWRTFTFMCHSLGGHVAIKYSELYPREVEKMVLLDAIYFFPRTPVEYAEGLRKCIDAQLNYGPKSPETFTYDEIVDKICRARWMGLSLTKEMAGVLAVRGVVAENNGFRFCHDPRLLTYLSPPGDTDYMVGCIGSAKLCPVLLLACTGNNVTKRHERLLEEWERHENCTVKYIHGSHDAHLTQPEVVGPIVAAFLGCKSKI